MTAATNLNCMAVIACAVLATEQTTRGGSVTVSANVSGTPVQVGTMNVTANSESGMTLEFTFGKSYTFLDAWFDFQWVQVVSGVTVDGVPQNPAQLFGAVPCVDPHPGQPVQGALNPAGQADNHPFYYNQRNWDKNQPNGIHVEGVKSKFKDHRFGFAPGTVITFETYLVAQNKTAPPELMGPMQFCILAGFQWTYTQNTGAVTWLGTMLINETTANSIDSAMANTDGDLPKGWDATSGCVLIGCVAAHCPGDCEPPGGDEDADVDDLLGVINHWGTANVQYNVAPEGGDDDVNVDDLLVVINDWGPCPPPPIPPNDECANGIPVPDGATAFDTRYATTDGPPQSRDCNAYDDPNLTNDIWFKYVAPQAGMLHISLCNSDFDTELAIYGGLDCPVNPSSLLACSDDECELGSDIVMPVAAGQACTIRIGGYQGGTGQGVMVITLMPGPPNCPNPAHSCFMVGGPGCADPQCCQAVCAMNPFCCDVQWDMGCVQLAQNVCGPP